MKAEIDVRKGNRKRKRICFFGHFGSPNFGNEVTLQTVLHHVRSLLPDVELACICTGPEALAAAQNIETVPISPIFIKHGRLRTRLARLLRKFFIGLPSEAWRCLEAFKILKSAEAFVVPGTGLLTDAYGLTAWGPYNLFKWSLIAKMCRCRILFVSVGAGPIYSALGKYFLKSALSLANFRSYRDDASLKYLKSIGFSTNSDRIYPDLVFSLPEGLIPHAGERKPNRAIIGLGLMPYAGRYSVADPSDSTYQKYLESLVIFVRWLLENDYDIRLLIGEVSDSSATEDFKSLLKTSLGDYDEDRIVDQAPRRVEQLLSQLAATDKVVATRFHNVLLALLLNKPVIAISFHHKCTSLMSQMGLSQYCHDIDHMNADRLIEQFRDLEKNADKLKPVISERVKQSRKALDEQYGLIFKRV